MAAGLTTNPTKRKASAAPTAKQRQRRVRISWRAAETSSAADQDGGVIITLDPSRAPEILADVLSLLQRTAAIQEQWQSLPASEICDHEDAALFNAAGKRVAGKGKR